MKSSPIMSLFSTAPPVRRSPSSFLISVVLHAFAFALLFAGLNRPRKVDMKSDIERYAVRVMELHRDEPKDRRLAQKTIAAPGRQAGAQAPVAGGGPEAVAAAQIPLNFIAKKEAAQTLIQPEVRQEIVIHHEAALPQIVQWSPPDNTLSKIVPPPPRPVATVKVPPTLDLPNQEMRVADLKLSANRFETKAPLPAPSKTSPVNVQAPDQSQRVPETAAKSAARPTPASIISLSDIKLQDGTATLPMVNEVAPTPFSGSLSPGQANSQSPNGSGKADGKVNGASAGQTAGNVAGKTGGAIGPVGQNGANGIGLSATGGQQQGEGDNGISGGSQRSVVRINQPKDGKFGVVVVGASLADDYPETTNMWRGRLAYTVYLHVGVSKNWILQFCLPRSQAADSSGSVVRPEAPWPYDITRPSIDPDVNADAIMVHGFVNTLGRFEQLAVIFPTELTEAKFLLHALQQWQFRPATQNGQATQVEVLLIIPDETE